MVFFCFARKACDKGCPENDIRDLSAQLGNDSYKLCFGSAAAHTFQNTVACMLDRKVKIVAYLLFLFHDLDQFIINFFRITVKNTDPTDSFNLAKFLKKDMQSFFAVKISTIDGCFLCNENQFPDSLGSHILGLLQKTLFRNTAEFTSQRRNDTVGTMLITAFSNLKISEMSTSCNDSATGIFRESINIFEFLKNMTGFCFI